MLKEAIIRVSFAHGLEYELSSAVVAVLQTQQMLCSMSSTQDFASRMVTPLEQGWKH